MNDIVKFEGFKYESKGYTKDNVEIYNFIFDHLGSAITNAKHALRKSKMLDRIVIYGLWSKKEEITLYKKEVNDSPLWVK